ncbi:AMP-binding protein [Paenibacillus nasutitermitis]|uniref:Crotonobetaine/carnitine-CoA ligase n=1 Tax=Paenibacillus nasutitermitis TaxID=1652958 RepID=A0A916YKM7_9BACL|nr:AMP-binding protein [Paenibacillus nasutitermitis]GGD49757.1 putative crotonobetaine/carnitine-CoA ligase [Paenibacillus nasutitermitis]
MDIIGKRTLPGLLKEKTTLHPDKPFILFEDNNEQIFTLNYKQFSEKVNRLSMVFLQHGVEKGDHVTLHLPNGLEFMMSWFALAHIGAVMVPTNILSTADEMDYVISHSKSVLLITEQIYLDKFNDSARNSPSLREILLARYEGDPFRNKSLHALMEEVKEEASSIQLESEDVAAMLYTSGTTSQPKGVLITHANYVYAGEVMSKSIRLSPDDRQLIVLPLFHGNAQYYSTMSALIVGGSIAITERFSASRYFKQAIRMKATVGSLFAAPIRMILGQVFDPDDRNHQLRLIWFAQVVTEAQLDLFEERYHTRLLQLYGMTEILGAPLMVPLDSAGKSVGIGRPTLGFQVKVVNEDSQEVPPGEVGQLIVNGVPGRSLMKGYFNNPAATQETIQDGWLYTGDNVRMDQEGCFSFVDRKKDMIKRSGENVSANEIEKVISDHPAVSDCVAIGISDEIRDESIKVYVVLRANEEVSEEDIISYCKIRLSKFKVPEYVEFIAELPRTSVGKIQKHLIRKCHEEGMKQHG